MFVVITPGKLSPGPINPRGVERIFDGFWVERWTNQRVYDNLRATVRNMGHARPRSNAVRRSWHPFYPDAVKYALGIHAAEPLRTTQPSGLIDL